jgi:hypothetical protein
MRASAPARSRLELPTVNTTVLDTAGLMLVAFALYGLNVDYTLFGDNTLYSDYVVLHKFDELTLHFGYFASLFAADRVLHAVFGLPVQASGAWLAAISGALAVGVAYLLARELLGSRRDAVLCAVIFGLSGRVLSNATSAEVYMLQTLFVLSSFYLFVRERLLLSGLFGAMALLVSPLSMFAYLFYPVYDYQRAGRIRWSVLMRLTGAALIIYLPFFIIDGHEVLFGLRGLMGIHKLVPFEPRTMLTNFPLYQFKAFTVLPLLLVPALFNWRDNRRIFVLTLAVAIPHFYIILKLTGEDHVFILNTDFFFACCLVLGWRQLENSSILRWIPPVLLFVHVAIFVAAGVIHSFQPNQGYADEMRRVAKTYLLGRDAVLITDWGRGVTLSFYGRPQPTTTVTRESLFQNQILDIEDEPLAQIEKLNRPEIFLLDGWAPSPLNRLFRSKAALEAFRRQYSTVTIAEHELKLHCELIEEKEYRMYRCVR